MLPNLAYTLLDSQGQAINSNRTQTGMLAALARTSGPGQDPYVTVAISNNLISGNVRSLSRSLLALTTPDNGVFYAVVDAIDEVSISVPGSIRHD